MANLVLTFAEVLAGAVVLDAAVKGDSIANVVRGQATQHSLPGAASSGAGDTSGGSSSAPDSPPTPSDAQQLPANTFASGITAAGLAPQVIAALVWAKAHGWTGKVLSGFRTLAQQTQIYNSGQRPAAVPGTSMHEQGLAVDVTDPAGFAGALAGAPAAIKLLSGASFGDPNHFSTTGH